MPETIVSRIKKLDLPPEQFIVIGSGILDAYGIRKAKDIDLVVDEALFAELASDSRLATEVRHGEVVRFGVWNGEPVEIWRSWETSDCTGIAGFEALMQERTEVEGINFISLEYVYAWKKAKKRTKDTEDIMLIERYLKERA